MKVMIRADITGVTGVVSFEQCRRTSAEFPFAASMLTHDLNTVADGLFNGGAEEVWVYDNYGQGRNIDLAAVDPRLTVVCGRPEYKPGNAGGLTPDFAGIVLLGAHAKVGTPGAVLAHTFGTGVLGLALQDEELGEVGLEAAVAGDMGIPVLLVTGSATGVAEARELLGESLPAVVVKTDMGERGAACPPPARTGPALRAAAETCLKRRSQATGFTAEGPVELAVTLVPAPSRSRRRTDVSETSAETLYFHGNSVTEAWSRLRESRPLVAPEEG